MLAQPNALQWTGFPGHYDVYYLTLTDPATAVGIWLRYTMLAPATGEPAGRQLGGRTSNTRSGCRSQDLELLIT